MLKYHINFYTDDSDYDVPLCKFFMVLIISSIGVITANILSLILRISVSNRITIFLMAILMAYITKKSQNIFFFKCALNTSYVNPRELYLYYMSVYLLRTAFVVNKQKIRKVLWSGMLIGFTTFFIPFVYSYAFYNFIDFNYSFVHCVLFACIFNDTQPFSLIRFLKDTNGYEYSIQLLQIEGLVLSQMSMFWFGKSRFLSSAFVGNIPINILRSFGSVLFGSILGEIYSRVLIHINFNSVSIVSILVSFCLFSHSLGPYTTLGSSLIILGGLITIMFRMDKFMPENGRYIIFAIEVIHNATHLFIYSFALFDLCAKIDRFSVHYFYFVTYIVFITARLIILLCLSPIIRKINPTIPFKSIIILIATPLFSNFSITKLIVINYFEDTREFSKHLIPHALATMFLSILFSTFTTSLYFKFTKSYIKTPFKLLNMANSKNYIINERNELILRMKMNRLYGDVNWPTVYKVTDLKLPYPYPKNIYEKTKKKLNMELCCGYCPNDPRTWFVADQLVTSKTENMKLILKEMKVVVIRQYHECLITNKCARFLTKALDRQLDLNKDLSLKINILEEAYRKNKIWEKIVACLKRLIVKIRPNMLKPNSYYRRVCYRIVNNLFFNLFIASLIILLFVTFILQICDYLKREAEWIFWMDNVVFLIFCIEFIITIYANSLVYIFRDGCVNYFRSILNIFDFIALVCLGIFLVIHWIQRISQKNFLTNKYDFAIHLLAVIRVLRIIKIFYYVGLVFIKCAEARVDNNISFGYEVAKASKECYDEILLSIHRILPQKESVKDIKNIIERNRYEVIKIMQSVQTERPWISRTIKTRQLIYGSRCIMKESLNYLRRSGKIVGFLDTTDYLQMETKLDYHKDITNLKNIKRLSPKIIFSEISWVGMSSKIKEFLFKKARIVDFGAGTYLAKPGDTCGGIYIIVAGVLKVTYKPNEAKIKNLKENGFLPIVDYFNTVDVGLKTDFFLNTGNSVGIVSLLTGRPMDCSIKCETDLQAYFIQESFIKQAYNFSEDTLYRNLEMELWKSSLVDLVMSILGDGMTQPPKSMKDLFLLIERGFIPDIGGYVTLVVIESIQDIVLLEGILIDYYTKDEYYGPTYIPRNVSKLYVMRRSLVNKNIKINTKVMIFPVVDFTPYDVMEKEEILCDLVPSKRREIKATKRSTLKKRNKGSSYSLLYTPSSFSMQPPSLK